MSHTPGPWRWEINVKGYQLQLCGGTPRFDKTVLNFIRWGMGSATARFRTEINLMSPANDFAEVVQGREHHAEWFQTINHPDARLIAAAPELLEALNDLLVWADWHSDRHRSVSMDEPNTGALEKARAAIAKATGEGA